MNTAVQGQSRRLLGCRFTKGTLERFLCDVRRQSEFMWYIREQLVQTAQRKIMAADNDRTVTAVGFNGAALMLDVCVCVCLSFFFFFA